MISEYIPREGDWPTQTFAVQETVRRVNDGARALCFTSPTGGGKGLIFQRFCEHFAEQGWTSVLMSNRRSLTSQILDRLARNDVRVGCRAADFEAWTDLDAPIQVVSAQTEITRVLEERKKGKHVELHRGQVLLLDECHIQKGASTLEIIREYQEKFGAIVIGGTATPLGIGHIYKDGLVVAGNNTQLRECGALVWANRFEPWTMDLKKVYKQKTGTISQESADKEARAIWTQHIVAGVFDSWKKFNPDAKPSIGFAPGVGESRWLVKEYWRRGVNAAHVDSKMIMVDGKEYNTNSASDRSELFARVGSGEVPQIFNRFVMREGIDIPEIYVIQLCTPIADFKAYLQTVGRGMRAHPSKKIAKIIDHAGCIQMHGNPNDDHDEDWLKYFFKGEDDYAKDQYEAKRDPQGNVQQQITCPECGAMRDKGPKCLNPKCGFEHQHSVRRIMEEDGHLRLVKGDAYKPRSEPIMKSDTEKNWEGFYWPFRKSGKTFSQAIGAFSGKFKYRPPMTLPGMPFDLANIKRKICEVPFSECVPLKFKQKPPKEEPVPEKTLFE